MKESNTRVFPKVSHHFPATGSTNDLAVAALSSPHPPAHGAVFITDDQSAGRGQGTNAWHSSPYANLTFSLVTRPSHLTVGQVFALSQVAALAVAQTVDAFLGPTHRTRASAKLVPHHIGSSAQNLDGISVKWPNDVYVGKRKIAGILIQNGLRGSALDWSVIGIGLNVNETDFPSELKATATSLRALTSTTFDLGTVLKQLLTDLANQYEKMSSSAGLALLDRNYEDRLYRRGVPSEFRHVATGKVFTGVIEGVNDRGQLVVRMAGGRASAFDLREVRLLVSSR
ncbi:biotin--[acetyl-CoA-carboxylase] ligase [Lewinella sp. 4G2]|uniref:biotin--[acetyl-CoA-carboxylase] ligase n=1 Tax=Lewinella sp. 4G2 TaxID=1803372 RepID=UPI0007B4A537|nr:biotin--[acetyl-CoA-carboxylase] ligase [Lewinella sp. 4G2]OAV44036.1 hypothetical protein A3850_005790 [Lewinella sp. 4G2]